MWWVLMWLMVGTHLGFFIGVWCRSMSEAG
jgi:hypothetical protein